MDVKRFLFLQGPHGPFFFELATMLRKAGHEVLKVGFNRGDAYYWRDRKTYVAFTDPASDWPAFFEALVASRGITDLVLYGDTRAIHAKAKDAASQRGLTIHSFEEGYLRPYWITYERGGTNGNSGLMSMSMVDIEAALTHPDAPQPDAPAQWGAIWHHIFLGSIYHANVLFRNGSYPHYAGHRAEGLFAEWMLHCKRLLAYPGSLAQRRWSTRRLMRQGAPYHVALLQLGHDASVRHHSDIASMEAFIATVARGFASGAPAHHQLVFKAHPLEDGREPVGRIARKEAARAGISDRVWFISGGKLGPLLDHAISAVTINSTAGQQALWRGLPLKIFGRAVYGRPEFVSEQPIAQFFAEPVGPDVSAYRKFRQFLLETSQLTGGYYTVAGRRAAVRLAVDRMLRARDIYDTQADKKVTQTAKLQVVSG